MDLHAPYTAEGTVVHAYRHIYKMQFLLQEVVSLP